MIELLRLFLPVAALAVAAQGAWIIWRHPAGLFALRAPIAGPRDRGRDLLGKPMIVLSGYRSPEHNRRVGGAVAASKHMDGTAFDIAMANHDPVAFEEAARKVGILGFGFYPRSGFIHIDLGPARTWGKRFPPV